MFRGIPNVGTDVYDAWLDSNYTITDKNKNGLSIQSKHYRNPLIDHWKNMDIKKVIQQHRNDSAVNGKQKIVISKSYKLFYSQNIVTL